MLQAIGELLGKQKLHHTQHLFNNMNTASEQLAWWDESKFMTVDQWLKPKNTNPECKPMWQEAQQKPRGCSHAIQQ